MSNSSSLLINGLRFHYLNWGGDGRPVVLVHGLASNAHIWDFVAPQLVAAGLRVFALDQRNHGLTDPAETGFDFVSIVRDLHGLVSQLYLEKPLLVGHSWGANVVLQYAVTFPAAPAGIVLVDGGVGEMSAVPGMTWDKAEAILRPAEMDGMPRAELVNRLRGWMDGMFSEAAVNIVLANFHIDADDTIRRRLPIPRHMQIARAIYEQKTSELLARRRCPALLCPAAPPAPRDEAAEQFLRFKREGVERAEKTAAPIRTVWFEDTVHDIPLHRPDQLAHALIEFSASLPQ